jgi:hypothetical protein
MLKSVCWHAPARRIVQDMSVVLDVCVSLSCLGLGRQCRRPSRDTSELILRLASMAIGQPGRFWLRKTLQ